MTVTNTVEGLEVSASKKCRVCSPEQQKYCLDLVATNLRIVKLQLEVMEFTPEQLGNGNSFEVDCKKFPMKTLEN